MGGSAGNGLLNPDPAGSRKVPYLRPGGRGLLAGHTAGERKRPALPRGGRGVNARASGAGSEAERRAHLVEVLGALRDRLRLVRVCCGDWTRILGPTPTFHVGVTGVLLDPPYGHAERDEALYGVDEDVAPAVRDWAIANGDNPLLRIALCGYAGEHSMPATWTVVRWLPRAGYGNQAQAGRGRANRDRETIWFSPHCLDAPRQLELDGVAR